MTYNLADDMYWGDSASAYAENPATTILDSVALILPRAPVPGNSKA